MFLRSPLYLYLGVEFFFCLLATMSPERPKNVPNSKFLHVLELQLGKQFLQIYFWLASPTGPSLCSITSWERSSLTPMSNFLPLPFIFLHRTFYILLDIFLNIYLFIICLPLPRIYTYKGTDSVLFTTVSLVPRIVPRTLGSS